MFKRFNEFDDNYWRTDKHMHSNWSDGEASIADIVAQAQLLGLKEIAITDHIRKESTYFEDYQHEILDLKVKTGFQLYVGCEFKISDFEGNVDVDPMVLAKTEISIASVHRFPLGRKLFYPKDFKKEICQEIELELAMAGLKKGGFNVLGHPGGMSLRAYKEFPKSFFEEMIKECCAQDIVFDLNSSYHLPVLRDLKDLLKKYNPLVSIGSDAHQLKHLDSSRFLREGLAEL